jgi:hypothetical protein
MRESLIMTANTGVETCNRDLPDTKQVYQPFEHNIQSSSFLLPSSHLRIPKTEYSVFNI